MMSLKIWILSLICEIANSWRFILFCLILLLGHFIAELFFCRNILLLGYFFAETFYRWAISYNMLFNHVDVFAVGIVYRSEERRVGKECA